LTRASCEYWPSGLPSASGFSIVMLGMMVLAALRLDLTRKSLGDRSRLARDARTARDRRWALTSLLPSYPVVWRPIFESSGHSGKCNSKTHRSWSQRVAAMQEPAWISWRIGVARAASPWQGRPTRRRKRSAEETPTQCRRSAPFTPGSTPHLPGCGSLSSWGWPPLAAAARGGGGPVGVAGRAAGGPSRVRRRPRRRFAAVHARDGRLCLGRRGHGAAQRPV